MIRNEERVESARLCSGTGAAGCASCSALGARFCLGTGLGESDPITLKAIVRYVIGRQEDVNGDGALDRQYARLLLGEID